MIALISPYFFSPLPRVSITKTISKLSSEISIESTMMFRRSTVFAAAAAFVYGASSGAAFAPSTCESVYIGKEINLSRLCALYLSL
jgi:hypothetical protein